MFKKGTSSFKLLGILVVCTFVLTMVFVDVLRIKNTQASVLGLPEPTQMVLVSEDYSYPLLQGLKVDPQNPLNIKFIITKEDQGSVTQKEAAELVRYFMASLTVPTESLWVNLSPYEQDRIINDKLGETDLGKGFLSQDYVLKQLSSSLTHPESDIGESYWEEINSASSDSAETFNKIWIVPDKVEVHEENGLVVISEASLKVMMENDYLAMQQGGDATQKSLDLNAKSADVMRNIVIPEISKDVNGGKNFAQLRQMYNAIILGMWFKKKFENSFYAHYMDQGKVAGIDIEDKQIKDKVFALYTQAFEKGVYNLVKKEYDVSSDKKVNRHYFSGGLALGKEVSSAMTIKQGVKSLFIGLLAAGAMIVGADLQAAEKDKTIKGANNSEIIVDDSEFEDAVEIAYIGLKPEAKVINEEGEEVRYDQIPVGETYTMPGEDGGKKYKSSGPGLVDFMIFEMKIPEIQTKEFRGSYLITQVIVRKTVEIIPLEPMAEQLQKIVVEENPRAATVVNAFVVERIEKFVSDEEIDRDEIEKAVEEVAPELQLPGEGETEFTPEQKVDLQASYKTLSEVVAPMTIWDANKALRQPGLSQSDAAKIMETVRSFVSGGNADPSSSAVTVKDIANFAGALLDVFKSGKKLMAIIVMLAVLAPQIAQATELEQYKKAGITLNQAFLEVDVINQIHNYGSNMNEETRGKFLKTLGLTSDYWKAIEAAKKAGPSVSPKQVDDAIGPLKNGKAGLAKTFEKGMKKAKKMLDALQKKQGAERSASIISFLSNITKGMTGSQKGAVLDLYGVKNLKNKKQATDDFTPLEEGSTVVQTFSIILNAANSSKDADGFQETFGSTSEAVKSVKTAADINVVVAAFNAKAGGDAQAYLTQVQLQQQADFIQAQLQQQADGYVERIDKSSPRYKGAEKDPELAARQAKEQADYNRGFGFAEGADDEAKAKNLLSEFKVFDAPAKVIEEAAKKEIAAKKAAGEEVEGYKGPREPQRFENFFRLKAAKARLYLTIKTQLDSRGRDFGKLIGLPDSVDLMDADATVKAYVDGLNKDTGAGLDLNDTKDVEAAENNLRGKVGSSALMEPISEEMNDLGNVVYGFKDGTFMTRVNYFYEMLKKGEIVDAQTVDEQIDLTQAKEDLKGGIDFNGIDIQTDASSALMAFAPFDVATFKGFEVQIVSMEEATQEKILALAI